jgi:SAM-dependent methyltransferase
MKSVDQMIALNRRQAQFYDKIQEAEDGAGWGYEKNEDANWMTRAWAKLRYQQQRAVATTGIWDREREMHLDWFSEKAGGSFLEIGCFSGSAYTFDLISAAGDYTGIELSSAACTSLRQKVEAQGCSEKAAVVCGDFLEYEPGRKFDFVYAHGVLHHFENPDPLFSKIRSMVADTGFLVFVEPVAINPVFRVLRRLYRPFQSDAAWEWPFQENTVDELFKRFEIAEGFGYGRFSAPLTIVCGIPVVGSLVLPAYKWIVRREVSTGASQSSYWLNSTVVAKCLPKT